MRHKEKKQQIKRYGRTPGRAHRRIDNLKTKFAGGGINIEMKITHANFLEFFS